MKSIAIVGAGPAGLVAAKTFLHSHPPGTFRVSIFEQTNSVGGLWAVEVNPNPGLINPDMNTNLSQFTVCFSDLAWDTLELQPAPIAFPKAWQVNRYLKHYAKKFIPDTVFRFRTKVEYAERIQLGWRIKLMDLDAGREEVEIYDYLLVASGLFSKPAPLHFAFDDAAPEKSPVPILHSSEFRRLADLSISGQQPTKGRILVVGGSHSGAEVAAGIALQMSDARYSAEGSGIQPLEVVHVAPHPIVAVPSVVQPGDGSPPTFLPLDTLLNDLSSRAEDPISFTFGHRTPEKMKELRTLLDKLITGEKGKDESKGSAEEKEDTRSSDPYTVLSDNYTGFVTSGAILPVLGRVISVADQRDDKQETTGFVKAKIAQGSSNIEVKDIAAIVNATGFSASAALSFLSDDVKHRLGFDASCPRLPLLLNCDASTSSDAAPKNLAAIGFSYGAYWGILETQARMIATKWSRDDHVPGQDECRKNEQSDKIYTFMTELRTKMKDEPSAVAQNFFGDYPGFMEEYSRHLKLQRIDLQYGPGAGMVSPSRYVDNGCDHAEAEKSMRKIQKTKDAAANHSAFAARAVFTALHGTWKATSKGYLDVAFESLSLVATFHPRRATSVDVDAEYLFILYSKTEKPNESSTPKDELERRIYRLHEIDNEIEVWSADHATAKKMLLRLEFGRATTHQDQKSLAVTAGETTTYEFAFAGVKIPKFDISVASQTKSLEGGRRLEFDR